MERKFIAKGAEAVLYLEHYYGLRTVLKVRLEKKYRLPEVDKTFRTHRTIAEAQNLIIAYKAGIPVPRVIDVDPVGCAIRMEYIEGVTLRDLTAELIMNENVFDKLHEYYTEAGRIVAKLHSVGIIHGDLSLTNFIVSNQRLYIIDFGLSNRFKVLDVGSNDEYLELCARDVNVFLRNLESNFSKYSQELFNKFLEGYGEVLGRAVVERLLQKIRRIRSLARYMVE